MAGVGRVGEEVRPAEDHSHVSCVGSGSGSVSAPCRRRRGLGLGTGLWAPPRPHLPRSHPPLLKFWYLEDSESGRKAGLMASSRPYPTPFPREGPSRAQVLPTFPPFHLLSSPSSARPTPGPPSPAPLAPQASPAQDLSHLTPTPTPVSEGHSPSRLGENRSSLSFLQERGKGGAEGGQVGKRPWGFRTTAPQPPRGAFTIQLWGSEVQGLGLSSARWGPQGPPSHCLLWGCDPSGPGTGGLLLPCCCHIGICVPQGPWPGLPDHCKGKGVLSGPPGQPASAVPPLHQIGPGHHPHMDTPNPKPNPWTLRFGELTGIGLGHCKVLLILFPGKTWSCAEPGPSLPQPKGQRNRRDGQTGTREGRDRPGRE